MADELVLTVPGIAAEPLYRTAFWPGPAAVEAVLGLVREQGTFVEREWAEGHPQVKQIVAFAVVHHQGRILRLRRARKDRRPALRLRYSVLFGGHVGDPELHSASPVEDCLARELNEELGIGLERPPVPLGVIADANSESGRLHLGVAFAVPHTAASLRMPGADALESEFTGKASRRVNFVAGETLGRRTQRFDQWSQILLYEGALNELIGFPVQPTLPPLQLQLALP